MTHKPSRNVNEAIRVLRFSSPCSLVETCVSRLEGISETLERGNRGDIGNALSEMLISAGKVPWEDRGLTPHPRVVFEAEIRNALRYLEAI